MKVTFPLAPGSKLGLLGGGQLGRMFAQSAAQLGYKVVVLEKGACPAADVSPEHINAAYTDEAALVELKNQVGAVTTEFENVPARTLELLAEGEYGVFTAPAGSSVAIAQDRLVEKTFLESTAGVPVAPHAAVLSEADCAALDASLFPAILKTTRMGYDGKGQVTVMSADDALGAFKSLGGVPCILEKRLDLAKEVSVIVARGRNGDVRTFPVNENYHRNGILAVSILPARIDDVLADTARTYAARIIEALNYYGVLCIEFFVLKDNTIVANEMAPRPHNSGHATIEACVTSQYEQQVRAMTGLPLGDTTPVCSTVMLNILGDVWYDENNALVEPKWGDVVAIPGAKLHLYGKAEARKARKMGHVTVIGATVEQAMSRAREVAAVLGLPQPQ